MLLGFKTELKVNNSQRTMLAQHCGVARHAWNWGLGIGIEDLNVSGMMANRKLALAIGGMGFYEFRRQLEYKCKLYGSELVMVDRWFPSSKTCSNCGTKKETLSLKERVFECDHCGLKIDRDLNASINLEKAVS